jgi:hypothetical protein
MDIGMIAPSLISDGEGKVSYVCFNCGTVARRMFVPRTQLATA